MIRSCYTVLEVIWWGIRFLFSYLSVGSSSDQHCERLGFIVFSVINQKLKPNRIYDT